MQTSSAKHYPAPPTQDSVDLERGFTKAHAGLPGVSTSGVKRGHSQMLHVEWMSDKEGKALYGGSYVLLGGGVASFVIAAVHRIKPADDVASSDRITTEDEDVIIYLRLAALSFLCLLLLVAGLVHIARQIMVALDPGEWVARRYKLCVLAAITGVAGVVHLSSAIAEHALVLNTPCSSFLGPVRSLSFLQTTTWNIVFFVYAVRVRCCDVWESGPHQSILLDAPWAYHFPAILVALAYQTFATLHLVSGLLKNDYGGAQLGTCARVCHQSTAEHVGFAGVQACSVIYIIVIYFMAHRVWSHLCAHLHQDYRFAHLLHGFSRRLHMPALLFIAVAQVVYWGLPSSSDCDRYLKRELGTLALVWGMTMMASVDLFVFVPDLLKSGRSALPELRQLFAWTEDTIPVVKQNRTDLYPGLVETITREPLFCLETAIHMFYWTCLAYEYKGPGAMEGFLDETLSEKLSVRESMASLDLTHIKVFYQENVEFRAILSWGRRNIVLAIRGTASVANVRQDLKIARTRFPSDEHTKKRSFVHSGFLYTWQHGGMGAAIIEQVQDILADCDAPAEMRVMITGHSLGAGLGTLAMVDLQNASPWLTPDQMFLYTFGAPRTGNGAFAKLFRAQCPNTWHVVNDQDMVARYGKFWGLYKRSGKRVLISERGSILVSPGYLESSVAKIPCGASVGHHFLPNYESALVAICENQLSAETRSSAGFPALLSLLSASATLWEACQEAGMPEQIVEMAQEEGHELRDLSGHIMPVAELLAPSDAGGSRRSSTGSLKRSFSKETSFSLNLEGAGDDSLLSGMRTPR